MRNKRFKYKIITVVFTLCIVFFNYTLTLYAYTSHLPAEMISVMADLYDAMEGTQTLSQSIIKEFVNRSFDSVGFLIDEAGVTIQKIKDAIHGVDNNFDNNNASDRDVADWILNNVTNNNGVISYGTQYNAFINQYNQDYVSNNPQIGYTFNLQLSSGNGMSASVKSAIAELCNDYPDCAILIYTANYSQSINAYCYKNDGNLYGVVSSSSGSNRLIKIYLAESSNNVVTVDKFTADTNNFYNFTYDSTAEKFILDETPITGQIDYVGFLSTQSNVGITVGTFNNAPSFYNKSIMQIPIFGTVQALTTYVNNTGVGKYPYYYNNSTWSNFVNNSSSSYTVDNSNINTVTYGDTISYINDYHDTNNNYPNSNNIGTWIENQNIDNSGGGSGGGGSGGGSGNTGIFDFLSEIGQVLGNLIKNLGKVLTDLISSISEIVSDLFEVIPTVFGDFLSGLFGWLPEDLRALIILGISAMVIVGLVKLIRG